MIETLIDNWYLLILAVAVIALAAYAVYTFIKMPRNEQLSKVQQWLLWAVAQAEKQFGSGTGQLKLRYVYDMFVGRFPALANLITFEAFSLLVDKALEKFNNMLASNKKVEAYVETGLPVPSKQED